MASAKITPRFLKEGDEVAIISPSFCIDDDKVAAAVTVLESWGLKVKVGRNALKRNGPFAGSDDERLFDLQEATANTKIKAVFCARGGYGLSRIINRVDFAALKNNPKWYTGFSDITVLHLWLSEVAGVASVHGEMPLNFANPEKSEETIFTLKQALFGNLEKIEWSANVIRPREVEAEVTGGNLTLLYSLRGTAADPSTEGKILFIEEVGEYYYHIDRMLSSLKLAGKLDGLAALVIGGMNKLEDIRIPWGKTIEETISDIVKDYDYPMYFGFPAGHVPDNRAFYIGRKSRLSVKGDLAELAFK
jgi:muramoyltetrapeptide carboxypeptidase